MESKSHHSRLAGAHNAMASITQRSVNMHAGYTNMKQSTFQKVHNPGPGNSINSVSIRTRF